MKFIDLNSTGGIGANSMYIEIGPFRLVVDSGIHPKYFGPQSIPVHNKIPSNYLDAIILTHCHLDHVGSIPLLSKKFPDAPILASIPSSLLGPRMMHNSVSVMYLQRDELELKDYPLYTRADVERVAGRFLETPMRKKRVLERDGEELAVTFFPAGHVAGAVSVLLQYKHRKIFITGDISFTDQWTITGAKPIDEEVDTLVMETTRGATARGAERQEEIERLLVGINETIGRGGSVLMPVFALGRMQEMMMMIAEAKREGTLLPAPVFCSGLGIDLADYFDELHRSGGHVRFSRKLVSNLKLRGLPEFISPHDGPPRQAGIYLISSGMMLENTPSYALAASIFEDADSSIFFVGYCDEETPGGEILGLSRGDLYLFKALDYEAELKAHVERFDLSGHADREELLSLAKKLKPRAIVLTHGDAPARKFFQENLSATGGVLDPEPLKMYEV